mgnify:FL=1
MPLVDCREARPRYPAKRAIHRAIHLSRHDTHALVQESFWKMVDISAAGLPTNKPRYLMGVGYPVDLVVCTSLGVDMFDCVVRLYGSRQRDSVCC